MQNLLPEFQIDLGEVGYWNKSEPFSVCLSPKPLDQLFCDAKNLQRIYELALITRPGDIWDYVDVTKIIAPAIVHQRIARVSGVSESTLNAESQKELGNISFVKFDQLFSWAGEDTEPVDEAWLVQRSEEPINRFADDLLNTVRQEISMLATSDPLAKYLFELIRIGKHPFDHLSRSKAIKEGRHIPDLRRQHTPSFYDKLTEIIQDQAAASIAYRGDGDFTVLRLLATEQRRRANITGQQTGEALRINALVDNQALNSAWNSEIRYFSEGLGQGDIFIQSPGIDQKPIKQLIEAKHRAAPSSHILSWKDEGDIVGYLKNSGEGWFHYTPR